MFFFFKKDMKEELGGAETVTALERGRTQGSNLIRWLPFGQLPPLSGQGGLSPADGCIGGGQEWGVQGSSRAQ